MIRTFASTHVLLSIYCLCVLLIPIGQASAQVNGEVALSAENFSREENEVFLFRNWKYHTGDNREWADPEYDDIAWEIVDTWLTPNQLPKSGWTGIGWFRLHFTVEPVLWYKPLALNILFQAGASEVYLDGERLYRFGTVSRSKIGEEAYWERNPKVLSFSDEIEHVLAVRYSNFSTDALFRYGGIPAGFAIRLTSLNKRITDRVAEVRTATIFQMVWVAVPTFLALQHLLLFLFYPKSKGNLYFAISTGCTAAFVFMIIQFFFITTDATQLLFLLKLVVIVFVIMFLSGMLFLYSLFYEQLPKQFWFFLLIGAGNGALSWFLLNIEDAYVRAVYLVSLVLFVLTAIVEMGRVIIAAILKKKDGAWIFGIGSIATLIIPLTIIGLAPRLNYNETAGIAEFGWLALILGPMLSMSVYLARDFARTSQNLEQKLVQVRDLSEQTLRQERQAREQELGRKLLEADNQRKTQELEEARKLQMSMLPQTRPTLPNLDIAFDMKPATEVGGDYYDFTLTKDGTLTVAIGDATGHGMNAGILVSAAKSLFQTSANTPDNVQMLEKIGRGIKSMNLRRLHMAMTLVSFKGNTLTVAAAGMPPMLIYRAAEKSVEEVLLEGTPLGSLLESQYQQRTFELQPGDTVLLMSDGLPERLNFDDEMLDYPKTQAIFEAVADRPPKEIIEHLFREGEAWANGRAQDDDVTFVVMQVK